MVTQMRVLWQGERAARNQTYFAEIARRKQPRIGPDARLQGMQYCEGSVLSQVKTPLKDAA